MRAEHPGGQLHPGAVSCAPLWRAHSRGSYQSCAGGGGRGAHSADDLSPAWLDLCVSNLGVGHPAGQPRPGAVSRAPLRRTHSTGPYQSCAGIPKGGPAAKSKTGKQRKSRIEERYAAATRGAGGGMRSGAGGGSGTGGGSGDGSGGVDHEDAEEATSAGEEDDDRENEGFV